jgi:galactokinase
MAPGCEPELVTDMMNKLREKELIYGVSLGGGGGGGFMIAICKEEGALSKVRDALGELSTSWPPETLDKLSYHTVEIDSQGLCVDGEQVFE